MDYPESPRRDPSRQRRSGQTSPRPRPAQRQEPQRTRPIQDPQAPRPASRRRRKPRKAPIRALCICAAAIFLLGFLMGFLVRGFFLPKEQTDESTPVAAKPPVTTEAEPPETTVPPETTEPGAPPPQLDDWRLILVNGKTPLPEGFEVKLTKLANGMQVDKRCYADLQSMISDCKSAGLSPVIASAYRTLDEQRELHESRVRRFQGEGFTEADARKKAAEIVAVPGSSEHHLGLAVDITDQNYQILDEGQENTAVQKWLMEHCWEYGFILRYPNGTTKSTGIIYEPWHYRYVGKEYATQIRDSGLCLEDWLAQH